MQVAVQISHTPPLIGMNTKPGSLTMSQPNADMQITTTPGQWDIRSPGPDVIIDQSKARAAYTGGTYREMSQRIYSGVEQLWLQGIAKRMEQGERMANFHKPGNSIAEVYGRIGSQYHIQKFVARLLMIMWISILRLIRYKLSIRRLKSRLMLSKMHRKYSILKCCRNIYATNACVNLYPEDN